MHSSLTLLIERTHVAAGWGEEEIQDWGDEALHNCSQTGVAVI